VRLGGHLPSGLDGVLPVVERDPEALRGTGTGARSFASSSTGHAEGVAEAATARRAPWCARLLSIIGSFVNDLLLASATSMARPSITMVARPS
jgi:hypothetical protein